METSSQDTLKRHARLNRAGKLVDKKNESNMRIGDARMLVEDMLNDILPFERINDRLRHHLTPIPADLSRKE